MKIFTILMVFFFTTFLVVPTVVSIINHDADVSAFFDMEEESEKETSIKEVKIIQEILSINFIAFYNINSNEIATYHDVIVSNNYVSIFSPPPELI